MAVDSDTAFRTALLSDVLPKSYLWGFQALLTEVLIQMLDASQHFSYICFLNVFFVKIRIVFQLQTVRVDLDRNVFKLWCTEALVKKHFQS